MTPKEEFTPFIRFFLQRLVPWGFIVLGGWMCITGARSLVRAKESTGWPSADGRILQSSVEHRMDGENDLIPYACIEYTFTVAGKAHFGDTVFFVEHDFSTFSGIQETVNKYPAGKTVQVRYLPTDPDVCLLEPGIHPQALLYPAGGLFFIMAAIVLPMLLRQVVNRFHVPSLNKQQADTSKSDEFGSPGGTFENSPTLQCWESERVCIYTCASLLTLHRKTTLRRSGNASRSA